MKNTSEVRTSLPLWASGLRIDLTWSAHEPVAARVVEAQHHARRTSRPVQPLVEVLAVGHGHAHANLRNTASTIGGRLRYVEHRIEDDACWRTVHVVQVDPVTALHVTSTLRVRTNGTSLQAWTTLHNAGDTTLHLQAVSSLVLTDPVGAADLHEISSIEGDSEWLGESRWTTTAVRSHGALPQVHLDAHQHQDARGSRAVVSHGTWSSGERVPAGVLATGDGPALAWQIEHNGPWRAELAERLDDTGRSVLVLGLLGPTDADHSWVRSLEPGEGFMSVPVSVAGSVTGWQGAVAEMTRHRRALRRPPRAPGAVVFNDYMNTLMGDPTTDKLLPLVDAAAAVGADIFCIDAGWYDDGGDWWDSVGQWTPSARRFTGGGLSDVLARIRDAGMMPGLWLEPEVVGVRSPLADSLPHDAFLQRRGVRLVEHERFLLDLRSRAARKHLDEVVDRLVADLGVGYLKLDYNVTPGTGTDLDAHSPGDGLHRHVIAYQQWLDDVLARHPGLVIENCASGGMRADYALLSRLELQSTSDQQDPLLYPPVAAGALMSILPEQAANWAYPQPTMSDEEISFTMVTGLSGRLYLSGRLDQMEPAQLALVADGVRAARSWDDSQRRSVPCWPLGLPDWDDAWLAVGRSAGDECIVAVWNRGDGASSTELRVPDGTVEILYPRLTDDAWQLSSPAPGRLRIDAPPGRPGARLLRVTSHGTPSR